MEEDTHNDHEMTHGGHNMGGHDMAQSFLRRFYFVTVLLVPLFILSEPGKSLFGYGDFGLRRWLEFVVATIIFGFGWVFFQHARYEIKTRQFGMMTLVSLAIGSGYIFSAASTFFPSLKTEFYLEIATLVWVLLFGHYLEARSSSAAGDALQEVAKLLPKEAHLIHGDDIHDVSIETLKQGDHVLVRPGEKVPADGRITKGQANFDEALVSGESKPVAKRVDAQVVAGSICLDGSVEIALSKVGAQSTIGQIQQLIANAQTTKPTAQRIADKASRILVFTALSVAIITLLMWSLVLGQTFVFGLTLAITVLVIACPHALGLAIPTVSTIATRLAVKNGFFIKDMAKLEVVKRLDYIMFDKTGTLTEGKFGVTDVKLTGKLSEKKLLSIAAALERNSSHVIASAITKFADEHKIVKVSSEKFRNLAGKGISGVVKGAEYTIGNAGYMRELGVMDDDAEVTYKQLSGQDKTVVLVAGNSKVIGMLALADQCHPPNILNTLLG